MDSQSAGGSSNVCADRALLDVERDIPTSREDGRVLRELRLQTPSWLGLTPDEKSFVHQAPLKLLASNARAVTAYHRSA